MFILLTGMPLIVSGQSFNHRHKNKNELAFIPGVVYDITDSHLSYVLHGHYLRSSEEMSSKISAGLSLEYIAGEDAHFTVGPVVALHPVGPLVLLYSPGITLKRGEDTPGYYFSNHLEMAFEFDIGEHLHLGPSAGFSFSGYDTHFSVGLHTGFAF